MGLWSHGWIARLLQSLCMAKQKSGKTLWLALAGGSAVGAWWFWPGAIGEVPLSGITLGMIGSVFLALLCVVAALAFLGAAFK